MWNLIKGWFGMPSLKSVTLAVLIGLVGLTAYSGWRWVEGVLTTIETQHETINALHNTIGGKDQQITTLNLARQSAEEKAGFYAARTEKLNAENKINAQHAQEYQQKSNDLKNKLRTLQDNTKCARAPVSDDVISVQRQSIDTFNAKYSR